ncbi:hypothetical protein RRG08_013320 [Elysia crispata]|uniref:Uncharacterized protein n=1 Tax=Elysia crispata TaxID=231223 RepID=A0AAE1AXR0_9GAST|nr:hypothetical protein RRG08_013320 [Elysia crispata]
MICFSFPSLLERQDMSQGSVRKTIREKAEVRGVKSFTVCLNIESYPTATSVPSFIHSKRCGDHLNSDAYFGKARNSSSTSTIILIKVVKVIFKDCLHGSLSFWPSYLRYQQNPVRWPKAPTEAMPSSRSTRDFQKGDLVVAVEVNIARRGHRRAHVDSSATNQTATPGCISRYH